MAYKQFAAGYLVANGKVLLVHHKKFNKWTPPGGHILENETPWEAVIREFLEETRIHIEPVSSVENNFVADTNCTPGPVPFQIGIYKEGFDEPRLGFMYIVRAKGDYSAPIYLEDESYGVEWFSVEQIEALDTFDQNRREMVFVLEWFKNNQFNH